MSVDVTKTGGYEATITWEPGDDPHGRLARAVETDELAYVLEALGAGETEYDDERALEAARYTTRIARLLEARAAVRVVELRDKRGMSWRQIAAAVHNNPDMQSTVRRQYDAGRRQIGH